MSQHKHIRFIDIDGAEIVVRECALVAIRKGTDCSASVYVAQGEYNRIFAISQETYLELRSQMPFYQQPAANAQPVSKCKCHCRKCKCHCHRVEKP